MVSLGYCGVSTCLDTCVKSGQPRCCGVVGMERHAVTALAFSRLNHDHRQPLCVEVDFVVLHGLRKLMGFTCHRITDELPINIFEDTARLGRQKRDFPCKARRNYQVVTTVLRLVNLTAMRSSARCNVVRIRSIESPRRDSNVFSRRGSSNCRFKSVLKPRVAVISSCLRDAPISSPPHG